MERTFAIIKPDAVSRQLAGQILARIEAAGFTVRGMRLQQSGRPLSAERKFAAAAALAPRDPDAQVAAAVGLYDKDRPAVAFGRLGPLVRRFPRAQTVRFHLGLLSIWVGAFSQARRELELAIAEDPKTEFAKEGRTLVKRLESVGTG